MTYDRIVEQIQSKRRFSNICGRDVTSAMMEKLGHPEHGMKIIHIAGTNGKGSVAACISSILMASSFDLEGQPLLKIGVFTSPHLIDFRERITINRSMISKPDVIRLGSMLLELDMGDISPTMFDITLAMAILYFKEQGCDYIVLETGLGGRLDSTTGLDVTPLVSVITSIGFDHTQILGDTLEKIAHEKAGIIKKGTKLVLGEMADEAKQTIIDTATLMQIEPADIYCDLLPIEKDQVIGLFGNYQRSNAAVAKKAFEVLAEADKLSFTENASLLPQSDSFEAYISNMISFGLMAARWPGRMQIVSIRPFILVDGAHNPQGVQSLIDSLKAEYPNEKFDFLMGVMADKDYEEMLKIIKSCVNKFYATGVDYGRALSADELVEATKSIYASDVEVNLVSNLNEFIIQRRMIRDEADSDSDPNSLSNEHRLIIFGSLYFIGQVLEIIDG